MGCFLGSAFLTLSVLGIIGLLGLLAIAYPDRVPGRIIWRYWLQLKRYVNRTKEIERALESLSTLKREYEEQVQIPTEAVHGSRRAAPLEETLKQMQDFAELHPEAAALPTFQRLYGAIEHQLTINSALSAELRQGLAISLSWHWCQWHKGAQRMEQQTV